ncbi:hypothetical protein VaNZ11_012591 [Volvox africanus]|uniref:CHY-type domain-containing protein n=1 Tax=Volvox africanus TaxID=51714 RepID=A0ABQ5SFR6_9CHLO|nr:hypothetical protein VaNZ11_012591 [Volvox africanus]
MSIPSEGTERRKQLELLQEELQTLKGRLGHALRLQRSKPAEAPGTAPFPIVLTFQVDPPPAATAHYDVSSVRIQIHLSSAVLQLPLWSSASGYDCGALTHGLSPRQALPPGTSLVVLSEELPLRLRKRIEQELVRVWLRAFGISGKSGKGSQSSRGDEGRGSFSRDCKGAASDGEDDLRHSGPYKLSAAATYMQESFVQLISLVPELLEPYQAEDQHGATVRRYTILCNDADAGAAAEGLPSGPQTDACQSGGGLSLGPGGSATAVELATSGIASGAVPDSGGDTGAARTAATALPGSLPGAPHSSSARPVLVPVVEFTATATAAAAAAAAVPPAAVPPATMSRVTAQTKMTGTPAGPSAKSITRQSAPSDAAVVWMPSAMDARTAQQWLPGHAAVSHGVSTPSDPVASAATAASSSIASGENPQRHCPYECAGGEGGTQRWGGAITSNSNFQPSRTLMEGSDKPQATETSAAAGPAGLEMKIGFGAPAATTITGNAAETVNENTPGLKPPLPPPLPPPPPPPPPGLLSYGVTLKELQYIQKRYSQVFSARVHHEGPDTAASGGSGVSQSLLQPGCLTTFELELLPTDPDWDLPAVRVVGQLLPVSDTAYLPSLGVHLASRLPPWLRAALETYMAEQLAAQAAQAEAQAAVEVKARNDAAAGMQLPTAIMGRGSGPRGGGARQSRNHVRRGRDVLSCAGGDGCVSGEPELAPEGTVLLPLGVLRNLFRNLENYAGTVARLADEERRWRERDAAGAAAASGGRGSAGAFQGDGGDSGDGSNDDGDGSGLQYDDDGYGDGSHRRDSDAASPAGLEGSEDYGSGSDEDDGGDGTVVADEIAFSGAAAAAGTGTDLPAAYAVQLEGLQLDNLAAVEVLRANFEVACARCGARDTVTIASSAVASGSGGSSSHQATATGQCQRCAVAWSIVMRPHFVHATSNSLCVIKPEGCRPVDLLPSLLGGQCGECNSVMSLRDVQIGLPFSRNCSSCHKEISIYMAAVSFVPKGPPRNAGVSRRGVARTGAVSARRPRGNAGGGGTAELRPGEPLPALGTCKHYRHSYRWLRFPCCGRCCVWFSVRDCRMSGKCTVVATVL